MLLFRALLTSTQALRRGGSLSAQRFCSSRFSGLYSADELVPWRVSTVLFGLLEEELRVARKQQSIQYPLPFVLQQEQPQVKHLEDELKCMRARVLQLETEDDDDELTKWTHLADYSERLDEVDERTSSSCTSATTRIDELETRVTKLEEARRAEEEAAGPSRNKWSSKQQEEAGQSDHDLKMAVAHPDEASISRSHQAHQEQFRVPPAPASAPPVPAAGGGGAGRAGAEEDREEDARRALNKKRVAMLKKENADRLREEGKLSIHHIISEFQQRQHSILSAWRSPVNIWRDIFNANPSLADRLNACFPENKAEVASLSQLCTSTSETITSILRKGEASVVHSGDLIIDKKVFSDKEQCVLSAVLDTYPVNYILQD